MAATAHVRPGWTLPAAGVGALALGAAWWLQRVRMGQLEDCAVEYFKELDRSGVGSTAFDLPCHATPLHRVLLLLGCGLALVAVAGFGAWRRSREAYKAGSPWPLRRALVRAASRVDRLVSGSQQDRSRLSPRLLGALLMTVALGAAAGGYATWSGYQSRAAEARLARGTRALDALVLPSSLTREGTCTTHSLCASSALEPERVLADVLRLLDGALAEFRFPCADSEGLGQQVEGSVDGHAVSACINRRVILVDAGALPPPGAVRVRPASSRSRLFWHGSDVHIVLEP